MLTPRFLCAAILIALTCAAGSPAQDVQRLCDFETPADLNQWDINAGQPKLVPTSASHGKSALAITFDPAGPYHPAYLSWRQLKGDWSGYDALVLDVTNPGTNPTPASLLIADKAWAAKGRSYWNRHNASRELSPGHTRWVIPLGGLYRGEAGSQNNDIKQNIDPSAIVRLDFGFGKKGAQGSVIIDDLRLVKVSRPAGVWAFDFGPPDQSVALGWTPVSNKTAYDKQRGFGWGPGGGRPWDGAARDTTFGPALLRDFCEAGGYRFRVDVPPGKYAVTLWYENSGYWGGEQAMQSTRRILVGGRQVWSETHADGAAHALWRFEAIEPVGKDIWDTYMADELAKPVRFTAEVGPGAGAGAGADGDGLALQFEADRVWGSKIAGLVIHRADDGDAAKWVAGQMDNLREEFRELAVCLDPPAPARAYEPPADWKALGAVVWPTTLDADVTPDSLPAGVPAKPGDLELSGLTARNAVATFCVAVRPVNARGPCRVEFRWDNNAPLPASVGRVWYTARRGFNAIAYRMRGHTVRPCDSMDLSKDITRELILNVRVAKDAPPGTYTGQLTIRPEAGAGPAITIPVKLKVSPVILDRQTDFRMGFFGILPPHLLPDSRRPQALAQTLDLLKESGMNLICGGPNWKLSGWKGGQPIIDFAETDRFFTLLREHGFDGPANGYGGLRFEGLHDGYTKGDAAQRVEKASGLPYDEALMRAWKAVDDHARSPAHNWPTIWYAMCDETRVRDVAERELEFMKLMARVSAAFPKTVRTSGSYSVSFAKRAQDPADMTYWHQQFFAALDISDLNDHDPSVLSEAARTGREVHIYNQGTSRYSFGLYQFSEFRKGVTARTQWHLNVLHGYQFFDLDGREPDTAMICYGRDAIYPTIDLQRCREGAQDFYLYNTLWKLVEQAKKAGQKSAAIEAGSALLDAALAGVQLNQHTAPAGYDADQAKAHLLAAIEALADKN